MGNCWNLRQIRRSRLTSTKLLMEAQRRTTSIEVITWHINGPKVHLGTLLRLKSHRQPPPPYLPFRSVPMGMMMPTIMSITARETITRLNLCTKHRIYKQFDYSDTFGYNLSATFGRAPYCEYQQDIRQKYQASDNVFHTILPLPVRFHDCIILVIW